MAAGDSEVSTLATNLNTALGAITNQDIKAQLTPGNPNFNLFAYLMLADYQNQYSINPDSPVISFLNNGQAQFPNGGNYVSYDTTMSLSTNIYEALMSTRQATQIDTTAQALRYQNDYTLAIAAGYTGSPLPYGHCFPSGTQILLYNGSLKKIEDIVVGDVVASFDINIDGGKGSILPGLVSRTFRALQSELIIINGRYKLTGGHVLLEGSGVFVEARNLVVGRDSLVRKDGDLEHVISLDYIDEEISVYNFEVFHYHTYIAEGIRVHNDSLILPSNASKSLSGS